MKTRGPREGAVIIYTIGLRSHTNWFQGNEKGGGLWGGMEEEGSERRGAPRKVHEEGVSETINDVIPPGFRVEENEVAQRAEKTRNDSPKQKISEKKKRCYKGKFF